MGAEATNIHTIPDHPKPLTPEQAERMAQMQIKKHHVAMILLHWFNAAVWGLEVVTGTALITSEHFRVAPWWFIDLVEQFFGGRANLLQFHIAVGLTWITVFLIYGIFGARTYLGKEVLEKEIALDRDDFWWLIIRTLRLLGLEQQATATAGQLQRGAEDVRAGRLRHGAGYHDQRTNHDVSLVQHRDCRLGGGISFCCRGHGRRRPDGACVHGGGIPRGEAGILLNVHGQG